MAPAGTTCRISNSIHNKRLEDNSPLGRRLHKLVSHSMRTQTELAAKWMGHWTRFRVSAT